ncbi:MAG: GH25 family lysozyme [Lachnospiraceae bacterium]
MSLVIDVSKHNGKIDWEKVKPNISGAILRCGYGSDLTNQDDSCWSYNVSECERLGIPYGVYLYSYASTNDKIQSEIKHTLRLLSGHKPKLPVFIDLEELKYQSLWPTMANEWSKQIRSAGYIDGVYSWASVINSLPAVFQAYWPCRYGANDGKPHQDVKPSLSNGRVMTGWQYTSRGSIEGISGHVDLSEWYGSISGSASAPASEPVQETTPSGSTLDIAVGVIQGKYGTGDTRKSALGTRYDEIQAFLNHISEASASTLAEEAKAGKYGNGDKRKIVLGSKYDTVQSVINKPKLTVDGIAREVIAGKWGVDPARSQKLRAAGYDPAAVQSRVNLLLGASSKPQKKSIDTVAREVIAGKWGTNPARRQKLTAAGYDAATVQRRVNELMR